MNELSFQELVNSWCMSDWEGCLCQLPKEHEGKHKCGYKSCSSEWTDEQSTEWWKKLKAEIPGIKGNR